jgi:hypothetical protein
MDKRRKKNIEKMRRYLAKNGEERICEEKNINKKHNGKENEKHR